MFQKFSINVFFLLIFCKNLINSQIVKSDSQPNPLKIVQQWPNQWPNAKWNESQWPSATWSPHVTGYPWPPRPSNSGNSPTKFPPLPAWPIRPIIQTSTISPDSPTSETSSEMTSDIPTTTSSINSSQRPPTTEKRPQTRPTVPSVPGEDPSKITVRSCGLSHIPHEFNGNKIVSGKIAKSGEFPWQVILKINTAKGNMQCGGAILNSKWVLTAAHCVSNERDGTPSAQRIDITAGVHNRLQMSSGSQQRTADCVIQHESWRGQNGQFKNDIALLRLPSNKPFELTYEKGGHVNGICLPEKSKSEYSGKARIAGWGLTKDRGTPSDVLLYTDVSIINNQECKKYDYPVQIAESMICQGVDRTAPCQGDSGGALIVPISDKRGIQRMTEIGVVSFGPGQCANSKTPNAIYTKVSHFLNWIEKNIQSNGQRCVSRPLRTDGIDKIRDNGFNSTTIAENIIF